MPPLPTDLRRHFEKAILAAREAAENGAAAALKVLAVDQRDAFVTMSAEQRQLRNALRARARALGGGNQEKGFPPPLVEEVAYGQWHRMLFARFLAENHLLMHPSGVPVTLEECGELAWEEGEADAWMLAARYARAMLPGIFRTDDPAGQVRFAPNDLQALERILAGLPPAVFTADDALGWVYQFWQTKAKKEVNESGRKIGGEDLAAVTQLFTENYMVRFLLENSLGAWWVVRHPESPLAKQWDYLRFREDGTPAAGTFPGWPERAAEVGVMDPCCGSGHFLVVAFDMLRKMRMEEEGLGEAAAADAVLCNNLFGLEIDARCTQLAAFALAFAAWKAGGYRPLPLPNIACSGVAAGGQVEEWTKLAGEDVNLRLTLERLYHLFKDAPDLGSLINPADVPIRDRMFMKELADVAPLLERGLARAGDDPAAAVFGAAAEGVARAGALLTRTYTLVATNVPYLGFKRQAQTLKDFSERHHPDAKMDLATVFLERCRSFAAPGGTYALVTLQNWLFLRSYKGLRKKVLREQTVHHSTWLGAGAFETVTGEVVKPVLLILSNDAPPDRNVISGIDASTPISAREKAASLRATPLLVAEQAVQLDNPDARILLIREAQGGLLEQYADSPRGIVTGDSAYWVRCFWELPALPSGWEYLQGPLQSTQYYGGREHVVNWTTSGDGMLRPGVANVAYGRKGVAVNRMGSLACSLYSGNLYDQSVAAITPKDETYLPTIWMFCQSPEFPAAVHRIHPKLDVTPATFVKVPFDLERWQEIAEAAGPLPQPHSNDPTQWLFRGHPVGSTEPLQVAVARLLGYHWPQQDADALDRVADKDAIVCTQPVAGEQPAAEQLRALLAAAYGSEWSPAQQDRLLTEAGSPGASLEQWMRDNFFAQHCRLFHNRPFIWHVWDGRRDGFSVLVNYHKLDNKGLQKLTYTYLGWWIDVQRKARDAGEAGADGRLAAALELQKKLELILAGEPPYDIYVRWKPLHQQAIGWEPDLNDGVRLNIRPFVAAGVLRSKFTINWNKDRGNNPDGSDRMNALHLTIAEKRKAREEVR